MIIILIDLSLLGLEYANLYILEIVIKGVVYSVKLKLEFAILGKLVQYVQNPAGQFPVRNTSDASEFLRPSHTTATTSRVISEPKVVRKRECECRLNSQFERTFEHVERKSINTPASPQYEPLHTNYKNHSDEDIERMMKRY